MCLEDIIFCKDYLSSLHSLLVTFDPLFFYDKEGFIMYFIRLDILPRFHHENFLKDTDKKHFFFIILGEFLVQ
jgi:hypothetical protein